MPVTFVKSSNTATATPGTALGASGQAVVVKRVLIGNPVNSGNWGFYNITNPQPSFSTNNDPQLAVKYTYESSVGGSSKRDFDFTGQPNSQGGESSNVNGLILISGGSYMQDNAMQATIIWDTLESAVI